MDPKIIKAVTTFAPLIETLILSAERTGASGKDKHDAVVEAAEKLYGSLQSSVKELRGVPWAAVAPLIVPLTAGLISAIVGIWNRLSGKVWGWVANLTGSDK